MPKTIKNLSSKIKITALEIFMEKGYEKTDMRYIAKKMGIAVGTLYNYYPSKSMLFNECLLNFANDFSSMMENPDFKGGIYPDNIRKILIFIFHQARKAFGIWKGYIRIVLDDKDWNSDKIGNIKIPSMDYFTKIISDSISDNEKTENLTLPPETLARILLMTTIGLLVDGREAGNEDTISKIVDIYLSKNTLGGVL